MSIIKQDYGELGGGTNNIDITNPDYISSEVTIAANGSYTFTTERRIKQCMAINVFLSQSYPPIIKMLNCETKTVKGIIGNPSNSISDEVFDDVCLGQTDTTIILKNVSSIARKYKLLAWF